MGGHDLYIGTKYLFKAMDGMPGRRIKAADCRGAKPLKLPERAPGGVFVQNAKAQPGTSLRAGQSFYVTQEIPALSPPPQGRGQKHQP